MALKGEREYSPTTQILRGLGTVEGNRLVDPIMHVHAYYDIAFVDGDNFSLLPRCSLYVARSAFAMALRAPNCYIYQQSEAILIRIRAFVDPSRCNRERTTMSRTSWNRLAEKFETDVCDITRTETSDELSRRVDAVAPSPRRSVLVDLGCGIGSFIRQFGDRFCEIVAVDIAPRMVERAKERCNGALPKTTWFAIGIERAAKLIGPRADLTACLNVITSPSPARQNGLWASVAAVTKPRGHALVVVPSIESARMVREVELRGRRAKPAEADGVVRRADVWEKHYDRDELRELLPRYGFVAKSIGHGYFPWSQEGLVKPCGDVRSPWDWVCLAQRVG